MSDADTGSSGSADQDDQLISDDQLPEDLQPDKNPMARDPDDERNETDDAGPGGGPAEGMPDAGAAGQPG